MSGIAPVLRVSQRVNDGAFEPRMVFGNGVSLTWSPDGPGWPREGGKWHEAQQTCQHLSEDGLTFAPSPVNTWRLPTVDEIVVLWHTTARTGMGCGMWMIM